jgi:hypothetical protein
MQRYPFFKWMKYQSRQENVIYLVLWAMLFVVPILSLYVRFLSDDSMHFHWHELWMIWPKFALFFVLFMVHNFLLAPLIIYERKRILYFGTTLCFVILFAIYQCNTRPDDFRHRNHPQPMEQRMAHDMEQRMAHGMERHEPPQGPRPEGPHREGPHTPPPETMGEHDIIAVIILILMFGANLGIKSYYRHRHDERRMASLEKKNLEHQLEYLKYQINPHFFMNTLNNIHALVDIDPEKAKSTIVELSKMMRFILYEGDKHGVPLSRECEFIRTYITLMRLRYTDKVQISLTLPDEVPDKTVPPLMLISFIENAFKHGISYQRPSFINIAMEVLQGQQLHFTCHNSKADKPNEERGGIGLANVRQRLQLLYDGNFTLDIQDNPDTYNVELTIPL